MIAQQMWVMVLISRQLLAGPRLTLDSVASMLLVHMHVP
jgi:hypothetical protein